MGYPDGFTQAEHDRLFDSELTDNEYREIAEELAEQDWDRGHKDVRNFLLDHAGDYIEGLAHASDDVRAATLQNVRRDCIGYLADLMESERVHERAKDREAA
jgi:hypothetical protein